jgi:hypothetical protein
MYREGGLILLGYKINNGKLAHILLAQCRLDY